MIGVVIILGWLLVGFIGLVGFWFVEKNDGLPPKSWMTPWAVVYGPFLAGVLIALTIDEALKHRTPKYRFRKFITRYKGSW